MDVDVPDVAGVPAVSFAPGSGQPVALLTADTYTYQSGIFGQQWGLFLDGTPIVTADSVAGFDFKKDWANSDYPVERGGFESYDKVETPFDIRLRFTATSLAKRQSLLTVLAAVAGTTTLYSASTPEITYLNVTVKHYSYSRTAQAGLSLLAVDVFCEEVRQALSSSLSFTVAPGAAATINGGTVQPMDPTPAQDAAADNLAT